MATISKTGIQDGLTSKAEHLTRIIDALDGTATTEVVATGSFTGSFAGIHTGTIASASYAVSASFASTAVTASFALSGVGIFPFTGSAAITGSLQVIGDVEVNGNFNVQRQLISNTVATSIGIESLKAGSTTVIYLDNTSKFHLTWCLTNYPQRDEPPYQRVY